MKNTSFLVIAGLLGGACSMCKGAIDPASGENPMRSRPQPGPNQPYEARYTQPPLEAGNQPHAAHPLPARSMNNEAATASRYAEPSQRGATEGEARVWSSQLPGGNPPAADGSRREGLYPQHEYAVEEGPGVHAPPANDRRIPTGTKAYRRQVVGEPQRNEPQMTRPLGTSADSGQQRWAPRASRRTRPRGRTNGELREETRREPWRTTNRSPREAAAQPAREPYVTPPAPGHATRQAESAQVGAYGESWGSIPQPAWRPGRAPSAPGRAITRSSGFGKAQESQAAMTTGDAAGRVRDRRASSESQRGIDAAARTRDTELNVLKSHLKQIIAMPDLRAKPHERIAAARLAMQTLLLAINEAKSLLQPDMHQRLAALEAKVQKRLRQDMSTEAGCEAAQSYARKYGMRIGALCQIQGLEPR
jgi:hypothetical protein